MKSAIVPIALILLLTGCPAAPSSKPDLQKYTKEEQKQAATEMKGFCAHIPMVCRMMVDYGIMRDQVGAMK